MKNPKISGKVWTSILAYPGREDIHKIKGTCTVGHREISFEVEHDYKSSRAALKAIRDLVQMFGLTAKQKSPTDES